MTQVLLCTGKKKKIRAVADFYLQLGKKQQLDIYSLKITTKRAMFWNYDELKLLFDPKEKVKLENPEKLLRQLDSYAFRNQTHVALEFEGDWSEDKMMKFKALATCRPYLSKGVSAKVELEERAESAYRIYYRCVGRLQGPADSVVSCKKELEKEKVFSPKKAHFLF